MECVNLTENLQTAFSPHENGKQPCKNRTNYNRLQSFLGYVSLDLSYLLGLLK